MPFRVACRSVSAGQVKGEKVLTGEGGGVGLGGLKKRTKVSLNRVLSLGEWDILGYRYFVI